LQWPGTRDRRNATSKFRPAAGLSVYQQIISGTLLAKNWRPETIKRKPNHYEQNEIYILIPPRLLTVG